MMKTEKVSVTRKFNIGNYQTFDVHVVASVFNGENPVKCLHALEKIIMDFWNGRAATLASQQIGVEK